jgi:pimeloyl-ACP methyl ester carboxylesterase
VFDKSLVTEEMIETRFAQALEPTTLATSRKLYSRASIDATAAFFRGDMATVRIAHLSSIKAPTLITWGRDDRVSPVDIALLPMRLIPNAELHVFPNCGHWAMIERKAEFESLVLAFLQRQV